MTESTATRVIVDSNVVIDIAGIPGEWTDWSIRQCSRFSELLINPIIYAELCSPCQSVSEADAIIESLKLDFQEMPRESLFLASQAYKRYRLKGGTKNSPLPDFFIGAHAATLGIPILTRDVTHYRTYFPTVDLICP
jgi:hypothetical protein